MFDGPALLVELHFEGDNFEVFSVAFARNVILPAVRANKCLWRLHVPYCIEDSHGVPDDIDPRRAMEEVQNILDAGRLADEEGGA